MKKLHLLTRMLLLCLMIVGSVSVWGQSEVTVWAEDFTGAEPSGAKKGTAYEAPTSCTNADYSATYSYSDSQKLYYENTATGTAPELLIPKNGGTFTVTITDMKGCIGDLTLTWVQNKNPLSVTAKKNDTSKTNLTISGSVDKSKNSQSVTIKNTTGEGIIIVFKETDTSKNVRVDNFVLKGTASSDQAINAADVVIDAEATSGEIAYTISNPDESTLGAAEKSPGYDWIDEVTVDTENNKVTFTTTANTGVAREGYITLTYGELTKDVKVTQSAYVEKYNITINDMTNGTVTTNKAKAAEGETVTLTATPESGYDLSTITVTDADGGNVAVSGTGKTRTFTMPGKAVAVDATFVVHVADKGEWGNPYTVDEIIGSSITGNKYVKGYIVGDLANNSSSVTTTGTFADSNLALATTPAKNTTAFNSRTDVIAVALPNDITRVNNKLSTHKDLIGKEAIVYGSVEDYFGRKGVKSPQLILVDNVMTLKSFGETSSSGIPGYSEDGNILYYTNSSVKGKNIIKEESGGSCTATSTIKITEGEPLKVLTDVSSVPSIENTRAISATDSNTDAYTWYEPYDYTLDAAKGTAYSFTGVSGTTLQFTAIGSTTLTANTPYLIVPIADVDASVASTVTLKATPTSDTVAGEYGDWTFKGTFAGMTATEAAAANVYGLNAGNKWLYFTGSEGFGMSPFRAYMVNASGNAKVMNSTLDTDANQEEQDVTAIELIKNDGSESRIYTLDGKYVGTKSEVLSKGLYIVNGKKFVIK